MSSGAMRCAVVLVAACQAGQAAVPARERPVVEPALAERALTPAPVALTTARPADVVDERGPYPVAFQVVSGPEVAAARLVYDATRDGAHHPGEVAMRRAGARWEAELPGQPAGSEIAYHFALALAGHPAQRWPASGTANYRVRVAALRVVGATLEPGRAGQGGELRVSIAAAAPAAGELRARVRGPGGARELRVAAEPVAAEPGAVRTLRFALPPLAPGDAADLDVALGAGRSVEPPGDARLTATVKQAVRAVSSLASVAAPVSDVRSAGGERWIAYDGGGVVRDGAAGTVRWRGAIDGLPSGAARFVLPDPGGDALVATDRGVAMLHPPAAGAQHGLAVAVAAGGPASAGAAARSALDGSAWLELDPPAGEPTGAARWLDVRDGQAAAWAPPDPRLVTLTSLDFDEALGCYALGALLAAPGGPAPAVGWRCGAAFAVLPLAPAQLGGFAIEPQRVLALARDPADGAPVAAIQYAVSDGRGRGLGFGVFRLQADGATAALVPIGSEAAALGAPIIALAADPAHRRLLVATDGRGLVALDRARTAAATAVTEVRGAPSRVTAVAMAPGGELIVGGRAGAWRIDAAGTAAPIASEPSAIAGDAMPMDLRGDRLLLGSPTAGPVEIARGDASWQVSRRLAEPALPPGPYGDAVYGRAGEIYVAAAGRGIARIAPDGTGQLLAADAGLRRRDLLRLLARGNGELWALEAPLPFAGGETRLSVLREGRVQRSVALGDRDLATVSRWLDTGRTVLAATRAGVAELGGEPFARLVSPHAAHGVAVSGDGIVAAVGDTIERRDGARWSPVLFGLDRPSGTGGPRSVLDVAIDRGGSWLVLFSGGVIAILDRQGQLAGMLDAADGVPATARRLLLHPASGDIVVGSGGEGLIVIGAG